jgi:hypothetical protein
LIKHKKDVVHFSRLCAVFALISVGTVYAQKHGHDMGNWHIENTVWFLSQEVIQKLITRPTDMIALLGAFIFWFQGKWLIEIIIPENSSSKP